MALFDWLRRGSPLQAAIQQGCKKGGNLAKEIHGLGEYKVHARGDAEAICAGLQAIEAGRLETTRNSFDSPLHALAALFQEVDGVECPAYRVMATQGTALLVRLVDQEIASPGHHSKNDVLFCLKILALYGEEDAVDRLVRLARRPFAPDDYMWSVVLKAYNAEHPLAPRVFHALSDTLPPDFIGVSLLDAANAALIAGAELPHPFDSPAGVARLRAWLVDPDPVNFSYAASTTAALPFLRRAERDQLLDMAMRHAAPNVRIEAAWAAGKLDREVGIRALAASARDINQSDQAKRYLKELDREDAIPPETLEPEFAARAEFANWLAHPNELGESPDEVEVYDHRVLPWPPAGKRLPLWLLRYRRKNTTGLEPDDLNVGLVGSTTFCLFGSHLHLRPPEDGYAIHCCWELEGEKLLKVDHTDRNPDEYSTLLSQWPGRPLASPRVVAIAEIDPSLGLAQRIVAVAEAALDGSPGFAVLDASDSRWYPRDEFPEGTSASKVLEIHIGSRLLGFPALDTRKSWIKPPAPIPPEQIVRIYERLLDELTQCDAKRAGELLGRGGPLDRSFDAYLAARAAAGLPSGPSLHVATYEKILVASQSLATRAGDAENLFDSFNTLGENFAAYVDALVSIGQASRIGEVVTFFTPHWDHNLGYGQLGTAAFKAGDHATAERFFLRLKSSLENWERSEEAGLLAEIWLARGDRSAARQLMLDALAGLAKAHDQAEPDERTSIAGSFQTQHASFLRLFPEDAGALAAAGIPASLDRR